MENILQGEGVRDYLIEGLVGDQWKSLARGSSIGHQRIDKFTPTLLTKVRWPCLKSVAEPLIRKFAVFSTTKTTPQSP
jgi:alpha-L-fucosidase